MIDPNKDGIDHINIYSKGKTELGRLLTNFAHTRIKLEEGIFESLEGYWYWLLAPYYDKQTDRLKYAVGFDAKKIGRELRCPDWPVVTNEHAFRKKIINAMRAKVAQHIQIAIRLRKSELPFTHYYNYNGRVVNVKNCQWILDAWEEIRQELKDGKFRSHC